MSAERSEPRDIVTLTIALDGVELRIWRRLELPATYRLHRLHRTISEKTVVLGDLARAGEKRFAYWHDFGDDWWHTIEIEAIGPAQKGVVYPRCTDGANTCPPEDCGGVWGFQEFKVAMADPGHPDHADLTEWYGGDYDPMAFSAETISQLLR